MEFLLNAQHRQKIMGFFFRYETEILLFAHQSIRALVTRTDMTSQMSEISQDTTRLPLRRITGTDILLDIFSAYAVEYGSRTVLPVLNSALEIETFVTRDNLSDWMKSGINTRPIIPKLPDAPADPLNTHQEILSAGFDFLADEEAEIEPEQTVEQISPRPEGISLPKSTVGGKMEQLAIAALETLTLPMLACNAKGQEIFYNEEWDEIRRKYRDSLSCGRLFSLAREKITEAWMDNFASASPVIILPGFVPGFSITMRAIEKRDEKDQSITEGYLFWLLRHEEIKLQALSTDNFSGLTLPEITAEAEKRAIVWAMEQTDGNQSNAAMLLGIPRQTFSYKFRKYFSSKGRG